MDETVDVIEVSADNAVEVAPTEVLTQVDDPATTESPAPTEAQLSKGSKDFTPEERATIVAMAKEVGFAKVAHEFGIKVRQISYWIQQEKKKAPKTSKAKAKGRSSSRTLGKGRTLVKEPEHIEAAPAVLPEPVKAIKPVKADKPAGRKAEKTVPAKPAGSDKVPERSEEKQALIIENAILKERISALNAEIEKLRAALTSLM